MSQIQFFKVNALPQTLQGDSFYYVSNGNHAESYLTNSAGVAKALGNTAMIRSLIDEALASFQPTSANMVEIVANIAARDAMVSVATGNLLFLVVDATGDATVGAGSALYAYAHGTGITHKVAEYESMDVVLDWSALRNRPTSPVADIDAAVSQRHTHNNKAVLDKLSEAADGSLRYGGAGVSTDWSTANW